MSHTLNEIASGVWGVETSFKLGPGLALPLRMTVLKDELGLVLVSPVLIDETLLEGLSTLGEVHTLLAPNRLHYRYLTQAKGRFPKARVLGAPGLLDKCPELPIETTLSTGNISAEISTFLVAGAEELSEVVILHQPSATLVVTDLVFNIRRANWASRLVLKAVSRSYGKVEQSRLIRGYTNDRVTAGRSVEELLALPFERVVPAHGDVIAQDAKAQLAAGLWWMRGVAKTLTRRTQFWARLSSQCA